MQNRSETTNACALQAMFPAKSAQVERWAVARVRSGSEFVVSKALTADSFLGYAPRGVRICLQGRHGSKRVKVHRVYAVIPAYVFVGCSEGVYVSRRSHEAIHEILGDPCGLPGVSGKVVADLAALEAAGEWDEPAHIARLRSRGRLQKGERVLVEHAAGVSFEAVVIALRRAGVVVESPYGARVPLTVSVDRVQRLG